MYASFITPLNYFSTATVHHWLFIKKKLLCILYPFENAIKIVRLSQCLLVDSCHASFRLALIATTDRISFGNEHQFTKIYRQIKIITASSYKVLAASKYKFYFTLKELCITKEYLVVLFIKENIYSNCPHL